MNAAGDGDWASASFTTIVAIAGAPDLEYPSNGAGELPVELVLDWADVNGAESYDLQVSVAAGFSDPIVDADLTDTSYGLSDLIDDTEYFWRVRAVNSVGEGEWSEPGALAPLLLQRVEIWLGTGKWRTVDHLLWMPPVMETMPPSLAARPRLLV